ncbi:YbjQ family protein [Actinocorallia populi]|uniref:YbjQ family protein n=1 Tax=Actinocorallia populi TaxID=2079200 RepID=UPI000D09362D|nr:heavy metal-binding domain-containing protein [Actinocorallia populi]
MLIVTTDTIPGYEVRYVRGAVSGAGIAHGGLSGARREAIERLKADAERYGCNAVLGMRFANCAIGDGSFEVYAYGTAVLVEQATGGAGRDHQVAQSAPPPVTPPPSTPAGGMPMVGRNLTVQVPGR